MSHKHDRGGGGEQNSSQEKLQKLSKQDSPHWESWRSLSA